MCLGLASQSELTLEGAPTTRATDSAFLLQTHALTAALLSAWGISIYITVAPQGSQCHWLHYKHVVLLEWFALGCFFMTVCSSLLLITDVMLLPPEHVAGHLHRMRHTYWLPPVGNCCGVVFLAAGFVVDVGTRGGCWMFWLGCGAAPGFLSLMVLLAYYLWRQRQRTLLGLG